MPGSQNDFSVARRELTGVRRPRHPGSVWAHTARELRPFALQPMRPGEILQSVSMVGDVHFNSIVNLVQAPMTYAEIGVWFVPIHAYGTEFVSLFTSDAAELIERGTFGDIAGAPGDANNPIGEGRVMSGGLSQMNRPWAGEIGNAADDGSTYVPYSSHGTHIIAEAFYGSRAGLDIRNPQYLDNPPFVSPFVRGASINSHDINTGIDENPSIETSLTQLLENMFLMSSPDRTFPEILAGFGVNPRRASGMPVPIVTEQVMLRPQHNPQIINGLAPDGVNDGTNEDTVSAGYGGSRLGSVVSTNVASGMHWTLRPMGQLHAPVHINRRRGIMADTFGMLIATVVTYPLFSNSASHGHMFDATRLLNLGHWGDPSFGGIEEIDFMTVQDLYQRDGVTQEVAQAMNLLNLYLHGDEFSESRQNGQDSFNYRGPGGDVYGGTNAAWTTKISVQFNIRTDLIGN